MGRIGRLFLLYGSLLCTLTVSVALGQEKPKAKLSPERAEAKQLGEDLKNPEKSVQDKALARIKVLLETTGRDGLDGKRHGQVYVEPAWVNALLKAERYADAEDLALRGILLRPEGPYIPTFQKARCEALLATGKHAEALAAARAYYNVCLMKDTSRAVDLITKCLVLAHPQDKEIGRRFNQQQVALSAVPPQADSASLGENLLKAIAIDPKPYDDTIKAYEGNTHLQQVGRGTLLLLAGRGAEAKAAFELALQLAQGPKETATATEGVARAIRAETAAIGPANAYILAQQAKE